MCTPTIFVISLMFCWYQFQWLMLALVSHNGWLNLNIESLLASAVWLSIDWFRLRTSQINSLNCNSTHSNWSITFHISFASVISINCICNVYDSCVSTGERSSYDINPNNYLRFYFCPQIFYNKYETKICRHSKKQKSEKSGIFSFWNYWNIKLHFPKNIYN